MDCRATLNNNDSFVDMLENAFHAGQKVFLLFDDKGMTRAEGLIKRVELDKTPYYIEIENGLQIAIKDIIAVNGIFLPEYGEC
jgi:hypothetical protein